jgi:uncharacterized protein
MTRWLAVLCFALLPLSGWCANEVALPALTERVTDLTGTLSAEDRAALTASLASLEKDKGAQIVIVLLPTTQPESIEQFGIRLAETWKIGRKGVDDGVIVIVAKDDRRMRIEVGYGLEGAIPDAIAKRIVAEQMAPRFRTGDFAGGLRATVDALDKVIRGEALPAPAKASTPPSGADPGDSLTFLLIVLFMGGAIRSMFGLLGSLAVSGAAGWLAWSIFASLGIAGGAALLAFALSFIRLGRGGWQSGGGFPGGFGGGSSGGGFSGGGGGFGGGGASGNW